MKLKSNTRLITNNPAVIKAFKDTSIFVDGNVREVFITVRDAVHKGATLLTHPLSGSIKPWQSPYKSILITNPVVQDAGTSAINERIELDMDSLTRIEHAISMASRDYPKNDGISQDLLTDFQVIDLNLIQSAIP